MGRTVNGSSCIDVAKARLLVCPDRPKVFRIRIDHDALGAVCKKLGRKLADDRSTVAFVRQFRDTDRDVDAERTLRLILIRMALLKMRIVTLQITYRLSVQFHDHWPGFFARHCLFDRTKLR